MMLAKQQSHAWTWDQVKAECDVLDQMASQTVLKACDIGDMLRALRLTMDRESFETRCVEKLNWSGRHADRVMLLSFRRDAVLKALSEGEANDSIRSAYEHVKALPAPETEQQERQQWPRAKRGPEKGSGGRPPVQPIEDASPPPMTDTEREAWDEGLKEGGRIVAEFAEKQAADQQWAEDVEIRFPPSPEMQSGLEQAGNILARLRALDVDFEQAAVPLLFEHQWGEAIEHARNIVKHLEKLA